MKLKLLSTISLIATFYMLATATVQANTWEEEWKKKISTLAQEDYVIDATKAFAAAFTTVREENGLDSVGLYKEELINFYTEGFAKEYQKRNDNELTDVKSLIEPLDENSLALQHFYMVANPHPIGSKHLLDQADDNSTWSQTHGNYHPKFRDYLEANELYDVFLIDLDSGDIIYSVFKEIDFTTSVSEGPYADTFKDAFKEVKNTSDSNFAVAFFSVYLPSYDDVAYFFMAPIYDGDEKIGAAMIQVPL